jgi:hypothetical protein
MSGTVPVLSARVISPIPQGLVAQTVPNLGAVQSTSRSLTPSFLAVPLVELDPIEKTRGHTVEPLLVDKAVALRHVGTTIDFTVASIYFNNKKHPTLVSEFYALAERAAAAVPPALEAVDISHVRGEKDPRKWYGAACRLCMKIIDECAPSLKTARAPTVPPTSDDETDGDTDCGGAPIPRRVPAMSPVVSLVPTSVTAEMSEKMKLLTAAEQCLRDFFEAGGHKPLDIIRRSMQLVCVSSARQDVRGQSCSTSSLDLPRVRSPALRLYISGKVAAGQKEMLDHFDITHVITCFKTGGAINVGDNRARLVLPSVDDDKYDMTNDLNRAVRYVKEALGVDRQQFGAAQREQADSPVPTPNQSDTNTASIETGGSLRSVLEFAPAILNTSTTSSCNGFLPPREEVRLLVHCAAGMHRCTAVCAAIMVACLGWKLNEALEAINKARPMAEPTESFAKQLKKFAARYVA